MAELFELRNPYEWGIRKDIGGNYANTLMGKGFGMVWQVGTPKNVVHSVNTREQGGAIYGGLCE